MNEINTSINIPYRVRVSRRASSMRIAVYHDASVVVTVPYGGSVVAAGEYVQKKFAWILKSLDYFKLRGNRSVLKSGKREFIQHRTAALALARNKVLQWNAYYNFFYNRVSIKNQKTRWGSCSRKGNLNFNFKIVHLPEPVLDYLVVHELCHLRELNHSKKFWQLVAQTIPNYKELRQQLKHT